NVPLSRRADGRNALGGCMRIGVKGLAAGALTLACDDGVMRATKARKAYAACLVRLAEDSMLRRSISLALGVLGAFESRVRESELVTRVRRILAAPEQSKGPKFLRAATAAVLAGALGLSFALARSPRLVDFA